MLVTFNLTVVIEKPTVEEAIFEIGYVTTILKNLKSVNEVTVEPLKQSTIQDTLCPDCNKKMKSRTGKYGVFWGCVDFPNCKGTRDSEGRSKADREAERETKDNKEQEQFYKFNK